MPRIRHKQLHYVALPIVPPDITRNLRPCCIDLNRNVLKATGHGTRYSYQNDINDPFKQAFADYIQHNAEYTG